MNFFDAVDSVNFPQHPNRMPPHSPWAATRHPYPLSLKRRLFLFEHESWIELSFFLHLDQKGFNRKETKKVALALSMRCLDQKPSKTDLKLFQIISSHGRPMAGPWRIWTRCRRRKRSLSVAVGGLLGLNADKLRQVGRNAQMRLLPYLYLCFTFTIL